MTLAARQYALSEDVFVALTANGMVFLNLRENRYLGIGAAASHEMRTRVMGWPASADEDASAGEIDGSALDNPPIDALLAHLHARGLLTTQLDNCGRSAATQAIEVPIASLGEFDPDSGIAVRALDLCRFASSVVCAVVRLRFFPLAQVIQHVRSRRLTVPDARAAAEDVLRDEVQRILRWRALFFSSRDHCLLDCLVCIEFLATRGYYPAWVFGVRTAPFQAHCWIQLRGLVLNDTVEHVRGFTPILVA